VEPSGPRSRKSNRRTSPDPKRHIRFAFLSSLPPPLGGGWPRGSPQPRGAILLLGDPRRSLRSGRGTRRTSQRSSDLALPARERLCVQSCERVWRTLRELSLPGAPTQFARVSAGHLLSAAEAGALGACTQRRGIRGEKWNPSAPWPLVHHRRLAPSYARRRHDEGPGGEASVAALPILPGPEVNLRRRTSSR
jgi:hypothetical protein